jgi:hypothetical protein
MRPILIADFEGLTDQKAAEARAIYEEIAG